MSGLLPVLPLKVAPAVAAPGAVTQAEAVRNDVRIPSRAALQQQLEVGRFAGAVRGHTGPAAAPAPVNAAVTLSPAARALSAILDLPAGPTRITSVQALWPLRQPPAVPLLAQTLAKAVDKSGLFYESHLQQFAAGTRTLAQLWQEPQAGLTAALATGAAPVIPSVVDAPALPDDLPKNSVEGDLEIALESALGNALDQASEPGPAETPDIDVAALQDVNVQEGSLKTHGPSALDAARFSALAPAGVHADAVALVRQQLELLAQPVFRWGGEAWPGAPMNWEIQQEPDDPAKADAAEASQRVWSTRLSLQLPELKGVDVRLSLVGDTLQLQLTASENGTLALLGNERHALPARFAAFGLQLKAVSVGALAPEPAPKNEATRHD